MKIMAKQATNKVSTIKLPNGQHTQTGKETLKELFRVHFPDSNLIDDSDDGQDQQNLGVCERITNRGDWDLAKHVIKQSKIRWVLNTFKPYKSAGTDEIVPALLQQGTEHLVPHLCRIFRDCIVYGFIPTAWRHVKVTFIPKPGKLDYTEAKAYRPISLSYFLLKTMEKLVDRHVRDDVLRIHPLHRNQHAYQKDKSTETALHNVVTRIEYIEHNDIALGAFLDIEGAFDRTSFDTIKQTPERHGTEPEPAIYKWICTMLDSRNINSILSGETLRASAARGCPQGGVLSPLLWSLVVDDLLWELNCNGYYTVGYADDIAILINGNFLYTVSEVSQTTLCTVQKWCGKTNVSINPNKTVIIPFTKRREMKGLKEPILFNKTIQLSNEVKYLGIVLDKGMT
jgi:hypothetical protein